MNHLNNNNKYNYYYFLSEKRYEISAATGLDVRSRPLVVTHRGEDAVALCTRGRVAVTGGDDGVLRFVDLNTHRVLRSVSLAGDQSAATTTAAAAAAAAAPSSVAAAAAATQSATPISCVALAPRMPLCVVGVGARANPRPGGREGVFYVISTEDMSCKCVTRKERKK